jgi:hypothetical protein
MNADKNFEAPSFRFQKKFKFQVPQAGAQLLKFGVWIFFGTGNLELGA